MAIRFAVALILEYADDSQLASWDPVRQLTAVESVVRTSLGDTTNGQRRLTRLDIHPDPAAVFPEPDDGSCDCSDEGAGYLVGMSYGHTSPPEGALLIQACDTCQRFEGDVDAAVVYAARHGGVVHAVGEVTEPGKELLSYLSDVWVMPDEPATAKVVWHTEGVAVGRGWLEADWVHGNEGS